MFLVAFWLLVIAFQGFIVRVVNLTNLWGLMINFDNYEAFWKLRASIRRSRRRIISACSAREAIPEILHQNEFTPFRPFRPFRPLLLVPIDLPVDHKASAPLVVCVLPRRMYPVRAAMNSVRMHILHRLKKRKGYIPSGLHWTRQFYLPLYPKATSGPH